MKRCCLGFTHALPPSRGMEAVELYQTASRGKHGHRGHGHGIHVTQGEGG